MGHEVPHFPKVLEYLLREVTLIETYSVWGV